VSRLGQELLRELLAAQRQAATRRRLLRLKDAAQYCSLSPKKLRRLIASQAIPAIRNGDGSGGIFLVDLEDLNRWISRMKE
jgi:excisionase family DNA binding protein